MKNNISLFIDPDATEPLVYKMQGSKAVLKNTLDEAAQNSDEPEAIIIPSVISLEELAILLEVPPRKPPHPIVEKIAKFFVTKILWKVQTFRGMPLTK